MTTVSAKLILGCIGLFHGKWQIILNFSRKNEKLLKNLLFFLDILKDERTIREYQSCDRLISYRIVEIARVLICENIISYFKRRLNYGKERY